MSKKQKTGPATLIPDKTGENHLAINPNAPGRRKKVNRQLKAYASPEQHLARKSLDELVKIKAQLPRRAAMANQIINPERRQKAMERLTAEALMLDRVLGPRLAKKAS